MDLNDRGNMSFLIALLSSPVWQGISYMLWDMGDSVLYDLVDEGFLLSIESVCLVVFLSFEVTIGVTTEAGQPVLQAGRFVTNET